MRVYQRWFIVPGLGLSLLAMACAREPEASRDTARGSTDSVADTLAPVGIEAGADSGSNDGQPPVTILFVGTSLTAGQGVEQADAFPAVLGRMLDSAGLPVAVRNAGVSGETSAGALRRIDWPLSSPDIDVLVLETGANDGLRGLDLDSTRANIAAIVARVRERRPRARIVLVQMESPPNMGERYTRSFRAMFPSLASETRVVLAPFLLDRIAGIDSLNQGDGIHPNEAGARVAARSLMPVVAAAVREVMAGSR